MPVKWDISTEIELSNTQTPPPLEWPPDLIYVPEQHRDKLLHHIHDNPSSGHPGNTATLQLVKNKYWWFSMSLCTTCNTTKSSHQVHAGLLQPLPIPQCPWSHIAIDFVTDLPNSQGNTTILTVVNHFSKSCRLIPLPDYLLPRRPARQSG